MSEVKLFSWNVNGIRAVTRKGTFEAFIDSHQPEVLCLQETKAEQSDSTLQFDAYQEYWNSAEKKGYSGTAIFSKTEPLSIASGMPTQVTAPFNMLDDSARDALTEGRVLTAEYEQFYLVTVYTPNSKDDLSRIPLRHLAWDPAFLAYCQHLEKTKPVVFCGDLNVAHTPDDLANPKPNVGKHGFTAEEREGFQNFLDAGYTDTFRMFHQGNGFYTWWSNFAKSRERNVGWRIDYFLVSSVLKSCVKDAEIYPEIMGSDHCPISVTLML